MKQELIYKDLCYDVYGLLFKVHNELGRYCNEKQCADLFETKLQGNKIKYEREKVIPVSFQGERSGRNRVDFVIEDKIIIDLKCVRLVERREYYQMQRYLKAFGKKLGLIVNFREKYLKPKRVINAEVEE